MEKHVFLNPFCDPYVKDEDALTYSKCSQRNKKKEKELQLDETHTHIHRSSDNNNNTNSDIPSDYVYHTIYI